MHIDKLCAREGLALWLVVMKKGHRLETITGSASGPDFSIA